MSRFAPLCPGDEIRVIAPSQSRRVSKSRRHERARVRLEKLGYVVTSGKYAEAVFHMGTAAAQQRADDFNAAFADKKVKAVMAGNGGWSANELLPLIDWDVVTANPKPLIGYSDITVLLNAVYAKTGHVTYLGPNFGTLGNMVSWEYTLAHLNAVLKQETPLQVTRSKVWGAKKSELSETKPWKVIAQGQAEAILIGGNLGTFYLLQGTEYQPAFDKPFIFALEDDDEAGKHTVKEVSRRFESLLQLPHFRENLKGLIIGRFLPGSKIKQGELESIIAAKNLGDIPVISRMDFGHTLPMLTLPIGGMIKINTHNRVEITINE